ncbi:MAG: nicotinamide-nucleotide amidohydrolase family protein [Chitinivibrionales bacterium]|nr:nicotinamide-nucleotide amidohydrolase family protein [Chitinivibrionales bacterium]
MNNLLTAPLSLVRKLQEKSWHLAVAESCTGGMIGAAVTAQPGSSAYFTGGIISYSNEIKESLLDVPHHILERHGAVSRETAEAMARGVKKRIPAHCSIAVTGIAGPSGGTPGKPVGLVYIAVSVNERTEVFKYHFEGDRASVRQRTVEVAFEKLEKMIDG